MKMKRFMPWRSALLGSALLCLAGFSGASFASQPVRIGVIAPASAIDGKSIFHAAELAAKHINAAGGIDGRPVKLYKYDDHASTADAVRAFQRAVRQDHVKAVVGVFISEIALALEPWSGRLKTPLIISGAVSDDIGKQIHAHYKQFKYTFHTYINSVFVTKTACKYARDTIEKPYHVHRAVVLSENANWTKPVVKEYKKCLPSAGFKLVDVINLDPSTSDFTPIYNRIEGDHAQVIMAALAHVGVKPVVQWRQGQVPAIYAGISAQATSSNFWAATNGGANTVMTMTTGSSGVPVTPKTPAFYKAYKAAFHSEPAYNSYTTYDSFFILKNAIEGVKSGSYNSMVAAISHTNLEGVSGHLQFYGPNAKYTHDVRYNKSTVGVATQWQNGKQVVVWPPRVAQAKVRLPSFVSLQGSK